MTYTSPNFESEEARLNEHLQNQLRPTVMNEKEKEIVQQKCVTTDLSTYMGGIIEIVLKTMI